MPIAVSACLLGEPCRYDGKSRPCEDVLKLHDACEMVPVCPEVLGGLPVPHAPCEIAAAKRALRVTDADGVDVTDAFLAGAAKTVELAKEQGCKLAVLKAKSPSCGCGLVYDGAFAGELVPGYGVAARALRCLLYTSEQPDLGRRFHMEALLDVGQHGGAEQGHVGEANEQAGIVVLVQGAQEARRAREVG